MEYPNRIDRRTFLIRSLGMLGTLLLPGCERLSEGQWFPRVLDSAETLNHKIHKLITPQGALAREYPESDISAEFRSNGTTDPEDAYYRVLAENDFRDWRLEVGGLVEQAQSFSLSELRAMPSRTQITRHDCVEGWSCIGKWKGARLSKLLERVAPKAQARYLVFYCADSLGSSGDKYYESIDFNDAFHPQTILAYELNDSPLPIAHGAPLRLRVERQLGYKMAKYIMRLELVASLAQIAGGNGGFWEDRGYAWYAGI